MILSVSYSNKWASVYHAVSTTVHQCSGAGSPSLQQTQVSALQRRLQEEAQLHVDGGVVRDALGRLRVGGHHRLSCTHPMGVTALVGWRPVFVTLGGEHTNHLCVGAVWKLCIPVLSACLYSLAPSVTYWHTHTHTHTHNQVVIIMVLSCSCYA